MTLFGSPPFLRSASIGSVYTCILQEIFSSFASKDSRYNLDYHSCHSWEGYSLVESGFADVAFIDYIEQSNIYTQGNVISMPVYFDPFVVVWGTAWKNASILHPSKLNPGNEILLPWNASFETWHKYWFGTAITPKVKLDHVTVIKDVLQDELFAIVPQMVAQQLVKLKPEIAVCELSDGPPDEVIHCLMSVSNKKMPQVRWLMDLLKTALQSRSDIHCLLD